MSGATGIVVGDAHACAPVAGAALACWGFNRSGEFGDGTTTGPIPPVPFTMSGARAMAIGMDHACALLSSGALECWGTNAAGQLGIGSTTGSASPVGVTF